MKKISCKEYRFPPEIIQQAIWLYGAVTLSKEEREKPPYRNLSSDRDCRAPHIHRRRAKGSVRPCRKEMTLDVKSVVGRCVSREKSLG
jgi:hypothetical protein